MNALGPLQISIPTLVRILPGALGEVGSYLAREKHHEVFLLVENDLSPDLLARLEVTFAEHGISVVGREPTNPDSFEHAQQAYFKLPGRAQAVVGFGDHHTLNFGKYLAFLARMPFYSVPTAVTTDGFVSPQTELLWTTSYRTFPSDIPFGVFIDTDLCLQAPIPCWCAGVGEILSRITAVFDWKLAYHRVGTPLSDLAILLDEAIVFQLRQHPERDLAGVHLLGLGLLLGGLAVEIARTVRPAYGSEHMISDVLDRISARPRLRGLQVGMATYLVNQLQGGDTQAVGEVLDRSGFWEVILADPFRRSEWIEAFRKAPSLREDLYTILSTKDWVPKVKKVLSQDPRLRGCFVD